MVIAKMGVTSWYSPKLWFFNMTFRFIALRLDKHKWVTQNMYLLIVMFVLEITTFGQIVLKPSKCENKLISSKSCSTTNSRKWKKKSKAKYLLKLPVKAVMKVIRYKWNLFKIVSGILSVSCISCKAALHASSLTAFP